VKFTGAQGRGEGMWQESMGANGGREEKVEFEKRGGKTRKGKERRGRAGRKWSVEAK